MKNSLKKTISFIIIIAIIIISIGFLANFNNSLDFFDNNGSNSDSSYLLDVNNNSIKYEVKGFCDRVVDGDTLDVSGIGRIRLVGVDTPERGESGYKEATDFVKSKCLGKSVYLDIDDKENKDKYGRVLAVVYVDGVNINLELLKLKYAKILYIPPSEFQPGFGIYS
ncbi:thermonuclease precursor [Methanobrevibacter cuticularis]|uniref:Thermonuclease n=1 Tax=Methanobrevibacter cuticularis TaxID=47311 RepID=A0A166ELV9_9EURY|nr:thermonuclease family protein [Methanobrevibacter cuticularis]KZX16796.1 thermonuclease precursor [Methanobrevibacter cuticularis]